MMAVDYRPLTAEEQAELAEFKSSLNGHGAANSDGYPGIELKDCVAMGQPLKPLEYLVEGIGMTSGAGFPHMIAGYGSSKKTWAAQSLLVALAAGRAVWGVHTCQARRVVHVDMEQGTNGTYRRYQRLARGMGFELGELGDKLVCACLPTALSLDDSMDENAWLYVMEGRELMLIDSFRAASGDMDENDSRARKPLDKLGRLSETTGCRALVIHHSGKSGSEDARHQVRGSSGIYDALDGCWVLSVKDQKEDTLVQHTKSRTHGERMDDFALRLEDLAKDGDPKWAARMRVFGVETVYEARDRARRAATQSRLEEDIVIVGGLIRSVPGMGKREIRAAARGRGIGHARSDDAVRQLVDMGHVRIVSENVGQSRPDRHFWNDAIGEER